MRCGAVVSKFEEHTVLQIHPPRGGSRETSVKAQLENFGDTEVLENVTCDSCKQRGQSVRRQYLSRVGPLLVVQLGIYDVATRRKFGRDVRICSDERVSVRVEGRVRDYELVAAVEHVGSRDMNSGHYVCYRRREDGRWLVLNDDGQVYFGGPPHGTVLSSSDFGKRQMYLCMYARCGSGEEFAAAEGPWEDDVFGELGADEVVDAEVGDAGGVDDLTARAMQLSLETAAIDNGDHDVALAIQRSLEDGVLGVGSGVGTSAASSSGDPWAGDLRSGGEPLGRPLRRRAARVGMGQVGGRRPLRRRDAMVDIDELQLSMSRLGVGDGAVVEGGEDSDSGSLGAGVSSVDERDCFDAARRGCSSGDGAVYGNTNDVNLDSHTFGFRHAVYDRMTFKEVYDADKTFVRFVLGLSKPRETSEDLWLFQIYCRQRELIIDSSVVAGDVSDEGIVPRGEDSSGASVAFVPSIVSAGRGVSATRRSTRTRPRRTEIAGMGEILAENQYVEREVKRRDFELVNGEWQDGVRLEGDPEDDTKLEPFLRNQFRSQQEEARTAAWGTGRTLGRQ